MQTVLHGLVVFIKNFIFCELMMKVIKIGNGKVYQPKRELWKGPSVKLKKKSKHHLFYYVMSSFKLRKKASLRLEEMAEPRGKVMANESSKKGYRNN